MRIGQEVITLRAIDAWPYTVVDAAESGIVYRLGKPGYVDVLLDLQHDTLANKGNIICLPVDALAPSSQFTLSYLRKIGFLLFATTTLTAAGLDPAVALVGTVEHWLLSF